MKGDEETAFDNQQFETAYPVEGKYHFWALARNLIVATQIKRIALDDVKWLEVGCGTGAVVDGLRHMEIDIDGCELSDVPKHLLHVNDLMVGTDVFDISSDVLSQYEGILLLDVLEHLPDRVAFLNKLFDACPNVKSVIITVPARPELWSNYDTHYGHYLRYTLDEIALESEKMKWALSGMRYIFHALYIPIYFISRFMGQRSLKFGGPKTSRARLCHRILAAYCKFESIVLPGKLIGTSVIACFSRAAK